VLFSDSVDMLNNSENELLDGRERLDCVSCPEGEADIAERSDDHHPRFGHHGLGDHHRGK
jgi:hypothetical protein